MEPTLIPADVVIDDARTRVVRWELPPQSTIGPHRHPWPYIVVPVVGGTLTFIDDSGAREVVLEPGRPRAAAAGVEHTVSNLSTASVVFVEVELKDPRDPR